MTENAFWFVLSCIIVFVSCSFFQLISKCYCKMPAFFSVMHVFFTEQSKEPYAFFTADPSTHSKVLVLLRPIQNRLLLSSSLCKVLYKVMWKGKKKKLHCSYNNLFNHQLFCESAVRSDSNGLWRRRDQQRMSHLFMCTLDHHQVSAFALTAFSANFPRLRHS